MWLNHGYFVDHDIPAWVLNLYLALAWIFPPFVLNPSDFHKVKSAGASLWPGWARGSLQREQD